MGRIILVTGGARSGKSTYAESLAVRLCPDASKRAYVATAQAFDDEMKERIRIHRERREGLFDTLEEPVKLATTLVSNCSAYRVALVDCLTVWTNNLLFYDVEDEANRLVEALSSIAKDSPLDVILVTNETGMGIVPANAISRRFRDLAGIVNQKVASVASNVVLMVCGIPMAVKGDLP